MSEFTNVFSKALLKKIVKNFGVAKKIRFHSADSWVLQFIAANWTLKWLPTYFSFESLLSHKINNHISYVTTLKEGIYINYRENQDKNYKTRLCLKIKRLTNVFLNLSVFILGWWLVSFLRLYLVNFFFGIIALKGCIVLLKNILEDTRVLLN